MGTLYSIYREDLMTTMFVAIPPDQNFSLPEGFRIVALYGASIFGNRPTSALITNEPDERVYKPENVAWGPGESLNVDSFTITASDGSAHEICGKAYRGTLCSFPPHETGRHSFEPENSGDTAPKKELYPDYYTGGEDDLEPWDVIKAFNLDYWRATALVYVIRAGRKPGNSEADDLRKAYTFLGERLDQLAEPKKMPAHEYPLDDPRHRCVQGLCDDHAGSMITHGTVQGYFTASNPDEGLHGAY
jgi:hypothetical protein